MGKQKRSENTYQKIQTVFKRDEKNVIMPFAELTQPEFDFLRDKPWRCEEKIDGTNIRIEVLQWVVCEDDGVPTLYSANTWEACGNQESGIKAVQFEVYYKGKTDNANINPRLMKHLTETYPKEKVLEALGLKSVIMRDEWQDYKWQSFDDIPQRYTIYGEGYGAKIQKAGGNYLSQSNGFIVFDVKVDDLYLQTINRDVIAMKLGAPVVPFIGMMTLDEPCPVVAVQNRLGLVKCRFLSKQFSGDPMSKNQSIDQPAGTVTTVDHHAFVTAYYGGCDHNYSIDDPCATITTKDRLAMVTTKFMANEYSGGGQITSIDQPCPAVLTTPKQKIVSPQYLMNPQFASSGGSIDKPCFTLIARMDKMPPYLISTDEGIGIKIFDDDTPMTRKVKEFMAAYGIIDIKMRMLKIAELKRIMGFPENYTLIGTQAEQKKFIGNAVEVNMSRVLCEALSKRLKNEKNG